MLVRFKNNLGLADIRLLKDKAGVDLEIKQCKEGETCELPQKAVDVLISKYGAKQSLFEAVSVKGEAKKPEITAPAK
jgi:hypothetical protein